MRRIGEKPNPFKAKIYPELASHITVFLSICPFIKWGSDIIR